MSAFQPALLGQIMADYGFEVKVGGSPLNEEARNLIADLLIWFPGHEDLVPRIVREVRSYEANQSQKETK